MRSWEWELDPKHLGFVLSRYKFVSKMLKGLERVVEIGAQTGEASEVVRREVHWLVLTDKEPRSQKVWKHDILEGPVGEDFDAAYSLDVLEHIKPEETDRFLENIKRSLKPKGVCIIGSPTKESLRWATEKEAHINCMTPEELGSAMRRHFNPIFMFGMNDEVLHTGFDLMRHYNLGVGIA